jgi:hypothetical protein
MSKNHPRIPVPDQRDQGYHAGNAFPTVIIPPVGGNIGYSRVIMPLRVGETSSQVVILAYSTITLQTAYDVASHHIPSKYCSLVSRYLLGVVLERAAIFQVPYSIGTDGRELHQTLRHLTRWVGFCHNLRISIKTIKVLIETRIV